VHADPEKLQQILINLLTNALKYTAPGGQITLECRVADGVAMVSVRDTGRGIAADKLATIFDPFVQVDRSLHTSESGVGLGLAISRELARAMGGDLAVESVVGSGSTFTLRLPLVAS
jgi:signal transduction histidine kinase